MEYLAHYGIKGMKWGVRKAISSSLSNYKAKRKAKKEAKENSYSEDHKEARRISKKKLSQMTNKELSTLNNRMQLENNYHRNKSNINPIVYVATTAAAIGTISNLYNNSNQLINIGKRVLKNVKGKS